MVPSRQDEDRHRPHLAPEGAILETDRRRMRSCAQLGAARRACAACAPSSSITVMSASGFGDTLQAVRSHRFADPLADPGAADLSAHVDFADLEREARRSRAESLRPDAARRVPAAARLERAASVCLSTRRRRKPKRITSPAPRGLSIRRQMGALFKALALTSAGPSAATAFRSVSI